MDKSLRYILLAAQAVLASIFIGFMLHGVIVLAGPVGPSTLPNGEGATIVALKYFLPATLHIIVSLVAAILLCVFYRANTGAEAQLLPTLFFMITLGNIKVMPLYSSISHIMLLSPYALSLIYHFATLFTAYLLVGSGLFQQGISSSKLSQYIVLGAILSVFLTILTPVSLNTVQFLTEITVTDHMFRNIVYIMELLAVINFIVVAAREKNRHNTGRCIAFILLIMGNALLSISQHISMSIFGLIFYTAGTVMLIMVTRTYHIWA
ncbi:MAG: hypothetical protein ACOX6K_00495 [Sphaerochaetaceae bacterium]|jgi:hypothetical protein